jgi:hypothetical protein
MPIRIQRKRTKGWRMPDGAVYVGRPTKWGNPYQVGSFAAPTRAVAVAEFSNWIGRARPDWIAMLKAELGGKNLACWCPLDQPCHADVLLEIANDERRARQLLRDQEPANVQ